MDFDGDWLEEVGHPWGESTSRVAREPAREKGAPYRRRQVIALAALTLLVVAALVGVMISERASADPQQAVAYAGAPAKVRGAARHPEATVSYRRAPVSEDVVVLGIPAPVLHDYRRFATRFQLDWRLLAAIGYNESDHGKSTAPGVHSPASGSCCGGIMEVCISEVCGDAGSTYGIDGNGDAVVSMFEDSDAVATAANILSSLRQELGPNPRLLLAAYNAGVGAVLEHHGVPDYPETEAYVLKGIATIRSLPAAPATVNSPAATGGLGAG